MSDIFISYRRDGGDDFAYRLYGELKAKGYDVFLDNETLKSGNYLESLEREIKKCRHFLVILAPGALDRCWNDEDVFRKEIEWAHKYHKNIVPVLKPKFEFPKELPPSLEDMNLRYLNGEKFHSELFDGCLGRLIAKMQEPDEPSVHRAAEANSNSDLQTSPTALAQSEKTLEAIGRIAEADITCDIMKIQQIISRAVQDDPDAQTDLAERYFKGNGLPKDYVKSREWLLKAVDKNHARGMYLLGKSFQMGKGVKKNKARAAYWFEMSATQPEPCVEAIFEMADCYQYKRGVSGDLLNKARWLKLAMDYECNGQSKNTHKYRYSGRYLRFLRNCIPKQMEKLALNGYSESDIPEECRRLVVKIDKRLNKYKSIAQVLAIGSVCMWMVAMGLATAAASSESQLVANLACCAIAVFFLCFFGFFVAMLLYVYDSVEYL